MCVWHIFMTVNPAVVDSRRLSNLGKLGSVVAGNSLGETCNPVKIIQRTQKTLNQ